MYQILVDGELFCDSRVQDLSVIDPVVTLEANSAGTFIFTVPPAHPYYNTIKRRTSIITVLRDEEEIFEGFCVLDSTDFFKQKCVECEGSLSFLNDSVLRPQRYQGLTVRQLLESYINQHNAQTENFKHFSVGVVTVTDSNDSVYCYTNYDKTLESIKDDLVQDYGGYIRVRNQDGIRYIDYLAESPRVNTQPVKLGENLIEYESNLDSTQISTVIIPLGATLESEESNALEQRVTIESVNDGLDFIQNDEAVAALGRVENIVIWDSVTQPANLLTKARKYLNETQFENVVITVNAIDLHYVDKSFQQFRILDTVRVVSKLHGLDKRFVLTQQTLNLNSPEDDVFVFGNQTKLSLSAQTAATNEEIKKRVDSIPAASSILESAIENASQLIKAAQNGYVTTITDKDGHPTEILVMDTNDVNTAQKVWRWNVNGLGYSNTGYDGTFGTAITMDGKIVADYITTGTLSTDRLSGKIKANSNVTIEWDAIDKSDEKIQTIIGNTYINTDHIVTNGGSIAGWQLTNEAFFKNSNVFGEKNGYYLGNDGFSLSDFFKVNQNGVFIASKAYTPSEYKDNNWINLIEPVEIIPYDDLYTGSLEIYVTNVDDPEELENDDIFIMVDYHTQYDSSSGKKQEDYIKLLRVSLLMQLGLAFWGRRSTSGKGAAKIEGYADPDKTYVLYITLFTPYVMFEGEYAKINRVRIGFDLNERNADYTVEHSKSYYESETVKYEIERGKKLQICSVTYSNSVDEQDSRSAIYPIERLKGNIFDTINEEIVSENFKLNKDGLAVYDDAYIKGIASTSTEVYNYQTIFELSNNGFTHKALYDNTVSGSALYINSSGKVGRSSSSARYKHDISEPTDFDCSKLYDLPVVQYKYNADHWDGVSESPLQLGFIAEDVAQHFPHAAVFEGENVETWEVRPLIPAMLKLIQEQNERIKKLEEVLNNGKC